MRGARRDSIELKPKRKNSLLWIFEVFENDPGFIQTKLFSFQAAYLDGRLYLAVADGKEPWNGLLVCASHDRQAAILEEFGQLAPHRVLGKWLYLSQSHPEFETVARELANLAAKRDSRFGVEPQERKGRGCAPPGKKGTH
jgi:hypothetical protein